MIDVLKIVQVVARQSSAQYVPSLVSEFQELLDYKGENDEQMRNFTTRFEGISNQYQDISQQTDQSQTSLMLAMVILINAKHPLTAFHYAIRDLEKFNGKLRSPQTLHVTKNDMLDSNAEIMTCKNKVDSKK